MKKKKRSDTPHPNKSSESEKELSLPSKGKTKSVLKSISFESSSDSETEIYLSSTQPRHYMKPPKFNGTSAFETFLAHFENCAQHNRWDRSEKLSYLKAALTDDAGQVLWDCGSEITDSFGKLVKLLKERFGGAAQSDKYRIELRTRLRKPNETLQNLHRDIRRLAVLAFPDLSANARESLACDYFLDSLGDSELKLKIRERNPKDMDDALKTGLLLEVWEKDAMRFRQGDERGKNKTARGVASDDNAKMMNKAMESFNAGLHEMNEIKNLVKGQTAKNGNAVKCTKFKRLKVT